MPRLTIAACASLPQRRICVRPWNAQKIAAILASGAAVGLGAGSGVALRERIGHSSNNSSEQSRNNDRQTHDEGGGLEVGVDLLVSWGSLLNPTGDPFILDFILVQRLCDVDYPVTFGHQNVSAAPEKAIQDSDQQQAWHQASTIQDVLEGPRRDHPEGSILRL